MPKFTLISTNAKLQKSDGTAYLVYGLALAPHRRAGVNVCPDAGYCSAVCNLWFSGRTVTEPVRQAMLRRTQLMFEDPIGFRRQLVDDVAKLESYARRLDLIPVFRPNVASDLDYSWLAAEFPTMRMYDYTKVVSSIHGRWRGQWPENYELTYSWNERSNPRTVAAHLVCGHNVAVVFDTFYHPQSGRIDPLPESWRIGGQDWPVVDGDVHDVRIRELDGQGVIVGLRFKGSRRRLPNAIAKGFAISTGQY